MKKLKTILSLLLFPFILSGMWHLIYLSIESLAGNFAYYLSFMLSLLCSASALALYFNMESK